MEGSNLTKNHIQKGRIVLGAIMAFTILIFLPLSTGRSDYIDGEQEIIVTPGKNAVANDSNLEFWFKDKVGANTFSKHQEKPGMMGGTQYYGLKYKPDVNEEGYCLDPGECVVYTVTSYPDLSDSAQYVTHIYISDPEVTIYGLTLQSSQEDIKTRMETEGYTVTIEESKVSAAKDDVTINFIEDAIYINVAVTNEHGIVF